MIDTRLVLVLVYSAMVMLLFNGTSMRNLCKLCCVSYNWWSTWTWWWCLMLLAG